MRATGIPLALLVLVLAGCGAARKAAPGADDPATAVRTVDPSDVMTKIVGGTPAQQKVLREILAGLGETVIETVRVTPTGKDWTPSQPHSVVVRIDFTKADENGRGSWEAALLAEAFERRSRALRLQPVTAYETAMDGTRIEGPAQERPKRTPITADELRSKAGAAAKESGARLVELRIVQPQHLALAITVEVNNPADYLRHHLMRMLNAIPSPSDREYDGLYLLVVDQKGKYVWVSAGTVSETISGGAGDVRPDLAGCDPVPRLGTMTESQPPPCPAD